MLRFLVAESETRDEREVRRDSAGKSAGETYAATLQQMAPGAEITRVAPADDDAEIPSSDSLAAFDAVFISGSPLHVYEDTPEVRRQVTFMESVFESGTPSFGSCAGLQLAVATAGGKVRAVRGPIEAGVARLITPTDAGRKHPLLRGRGECWDAPAIHGDEVEELPDGATLLASNAATHVQAAEVRHRRGVFWGVQYHPELAIGEIAAALRRQSARLIADGLAEDHAAVESQALLFDALHNDPGSAALRWRLGVDEAFAEERLRRTEIANFIATQVGVSKDS